MKNIRYVIVAIGVSLCIAHQGLSQQVIPGITAAASLNNVNLKGLTGISTDISSVDGIEAGLYLSFTSGSWYVRPMAVASFLRGDVTSTNDAIEEAQPSESKFNMTTLETPVLVGLKFLPGIAIEGGPSWNYLMSYTDEIEGVELDLDQHNFGYRAGLRITFARFGIFGHYGGMINENNGAANYSLTRPSRLIFGASIDIGGVRN